MGFDVGSILRRFTSAYDIEQREPSALPTGFDLRTSKLLVEGEASDTKILTFELDAFNKHTITVDPTTGDISWETSSGGTRTLRCEGFSSWEVVSVRLDQIVLDLGLSRFEVNAAGIARFSDIDCSLLLLGDDVSDRTIDDPFRHLSEADSDDWWLASSGPWSMANNNISVETDKTFALFFNDQGKEEWLADLNTYATEDLRIGGRFMERIVRIFRMGYFARWEQSKDDVQNNLAVVDRTGPALTETGKFWGQQRGDGQTDEDLLLEILFEQRKRIGDVTTKGIQRALETALSASEGSIDIISNVDPVDGGWRARHFKAVFPQSALEEAFDPPFEDDTARIEELLDRIRGAAINSVVEIISATVYQGTGYIENGSFEDYDTTPGLPASWDNATASGTTFEREETIFVDGDQGLKVTVAGNVGDEGVQQDFDVPETTKYTAKVQTRTGGTAGEVPKLEVVETGTGNSEGTATGSDGGTSFEELSVTWEGDSVSQYRVKLVQDGGSGGEVLFFDVAEVVMAHEDETVATYGGDGTETDDIYSS